MTKKEFVIPGDQIATVEEVTFVKGGYQDEDDFRSLFTGTVERDPAQHEAKIVGGPDRVRYAGMHTVIEGFVKNVTGSVAIIEIINIVGIKRPYVPAKDAILLVSMSARDYVENIKDLYKIGDFIRAKVVGVDHGTYKLATKFPEYGVVKAVCTTCRKSLNNENGKFYCSDCGHEEHRKAARLDYQR